LLRQFVPLRFLIDGDWNHSPSAVYPDPQ
jgi:hypothetical protein